MLINMLRGLLLVVLVTVAGPVLAEDLATPEQAQAMVDKAIAFFDKNGKDAAFAEITNKQGQFIDRDLYVLAGDMNGIFLAHGANAGLIGKDITALKDVNGKWIGTEIVNSAKTHPEGGWVEYVWTNPATKKLAPKRTWVKAHGGYFFGAGVYDTTKAAP